MVSEHSNLRPASKGSTMEKEENYYVRVGRSFKETQNTMSILSDLKNFITKHFNLPHIQVSEGSNGGVVISNLFEGIPDDVESQDHESFDCILKLIGWIEGCVELPICSDSGAHKVLDEMPQSANISEIDHIDELLKNDGEQTIANKVFDENLSCDVLKSDEIVVQGEEMDRSMFKDKANDFKDSTNLDAYQVFNERPEPHADFKTLEVSDLPVATPLMVVKKKFIDLIGVLDKLLAQEDYIGVLCIDPGGEKSVFLVGDSFALKSALLEKNCNLWWIDDEFSEIKILYGKGFHEMPMMMVSNESYKEIYHALKLCFDPGGKLILLVDSLN